MVSQKDITTSSCQVWCKWKLPLFDNVFNINVNTVPDIQIHSVYRTFWPTAGQKCSENRGQVYDQFGHS